MLTVNEHALPLTYLPVDPVRTLAELINRECEGVRRGQVEQRNTLLCHPVSIVLMFAPGVYYTRHTRSCQAMQIFWQYAPADSKVWRYPAHI
jgi:hypothetical protein